MASQRQASGGSPTQARIVGEIPYTAECPGRSIPGVYIVELLIRSQDSGFDRESVQLRPLLQAELFS
jgi:hypothetical protein